MKNSKLSIFQFIIGITLGFTGAILMLLGSLPVSARITIWIIGPALTATQDADYQNENRTLAKL